MALRRGFKTEAEATAGETRDELGLGPLDRLDPLTLAGHLAIPVLALSDLAADSRQIRHLLDVEPEAFSAVTVFRGRHRTIVQNDSHNIGRQSSNIAHELAHGLLQHPPTPALDDRGCRDWNQDLEDEAGWLGGCLLVTEDAALTVARGTWSKAQAAEQLGVSDRMIQFRLNATGAVRRVARTRSARARGFKSPVSRTGRPPTPRAGA